jgi:Icc-related predicted phosphoesterase
MEWPASCTIIFQEVRNLFRYRGINHTTQYQLYSKVGRPSKQQHDPKKQQNRFLSNANTTNDSSMADEKIKIRIVCISDTHNASPGEGYTLPRGDILIHAGDLTNNGQPSEIRKAIAWLREADYEHKIVIAGNHDLALDEHFPNQHDDATQLRQMMREDDKITYLEHENKVVTIKGTKIKVFGSPYSPASASKQWAFQYPPSQAEQLWPDIPPDTTVLITHTPPAGHLDTSAHWTQGGCPALSQALYRTAPLLHVCGHCHEGRGGQTVCWNDKAEAEHGVTEWQDPGSGNKKQCLFDLTKKSRKAAGADGAAKETAIVNASIMAKSYGRGAKAFNKPIVVDIELPIVVD